MANATQNNSELRAPPRIGAAANRQLRVALVCAAGLLIAGGGILFAFNPAHYAFYPRCFFYQVTGLLCPGCGGLRATHQLLHGHVLEAFRFNALFVLSLPTAAAWALRKFFFANSAPTRVLPWLWIAISAGVLFTVLRNLPAFRFLAP